MNNPELMIVLSIGLVLMCVPISLQMKRYGIIAWKSIVVSIVLVLVGMYGSRLWYFVENFTFRGRSFYGAIFVAPLVFIPVAKILRIPYGDIMDMVAPAGCLTLAMVKIQCLRDGCCTGMPMYIDENHVYVKFPSQIVEMVAFLVISIVLFIISLRPTARKKVFLWFLVLYGGSRFILDFFRAHDEPYLLGLSAGSFWSVIACVIGVLGLVLGKRFIYKKNNNMNYN